MYPLWQAAIEAILEFLDRAQKAGKPRTPDVPVLISAILAIDEPVLLLQSVRRYLFSVS